MLALLTADMKNVTVDFDKEFIVSNNIGIPFDSVGLNAEPTLNATYTIKNTYETSSGKFSEAHVKLNIDNRKKFADLLK